MERINKIISNEKYKNYVNQIEQAEKNRKFCLHGMAHSLDVARIAYILNLEEMLYMDKEIIYATALLHDIGRAREYEDGSSHHIAGADMAEEILEEAGFEAAAIKKICIAIASHKEHGKGDELLDILYRADKLSRSCFNCSAYNECYWDEDKKNKRIIY